MDLTYSKYLDSTQDAQECYELLQVFRRLIDMNDMQGHLKTESRCVLHEFRTTCIHNLNISSAINKDPGLCNLSILVEF